MHFSQERGFAVHRAQNERQVPFTRIEHVNHVIGISRVTWIIIEL